MSIGFKDRWAARQKAALLRLKEYWNAIYRERLPKRPEDEDRPPPLPKPPSQQNMEW